MTSILTRNTKKIRHEITDLTQAEDMCAGSQKVSEMVRSLTVQDDLDLVKSAMINRYAQYIVPITDEATGATTDRLRSSDVQTRMDEGARRAIIVGQQEILRLYLFPSIVRQRASLFSEPGLSYAYTDENAEEIIAPVRADGGDLVSCLRWDTFADGIGCCALYIADAGGVMQYSEIPPNKLHIAFAQTITDGDSDRVTNQGDIDEASVVCIEIAPNGSKRRFVSWFGTSDKYPLGRCCSYTASNWYDVPDVGASDLEYSESAKTFVQGAMDPANPLEMIAQTQGAIGQPVYPVVILYGSAMSSGLLPVSSSLYDVCGEFDLAGSLILGSAGRGARGAKLFKRGTDTAIPDNVDEGMILGGMDQDLINVGWPASHSVDASRVVNEWARHVAEAHEVPGWLVVADDVSTVPSGVALEIMTQPLQRNRNNRIALNRSSVARKWSIERLIINGAVGNPEIGYDCEETWNPGKRSFPVDLEASVRTWQARISAGEADLADMVQELRQIKSREAAINWIEGRSQEVKEKPFLKPAVTKSSLAERLTASAGGGRK